MEDQVTLTAYTDEVRELIRNNRNDEAISICKHVLRYYPKYIDAYRQMGEAYLEKGDLEDAKELFRRVLSADPENVVAYVGLAVVFEQQQAFEEAVWHLERAYELAPENAELRKELLRLYAEVDGKAHLRLKPTPGALARLYAKEGLLAQAIQEYRSIVSRAPARFDARIGLAELLWHSGRLREAADLAQQVLAELPYCLKANLILGTTWKETGVSDSDVYLNRAQALDPTNQIAQRTLGTRSPLPLNKPQVPRYVEAPPEPAPSFISEPAPAEAPAGLEAFAPAEPSIETPIAVELPQAETPVEAELPAEPVGLAPTEPEPQQTEAPAQSELSGLIEPSVKPSVTDTTLPPWLHVTFPKPVEAEPASEPVSALPAWLKQLPPTQVQPAETVEAEEKVAESTLPPWIVEKPQIEAPPPQAPQAELPSWMTELPAAQEVAAQPVAGEEEQAQAGLPSWIAEQAVAQQTQVEKVPPEAPPLQAPQAELPSWMAELPASQAEAQELAGEEPSPQAPQAELPSWMTELPALQAEAQELAGEEPPPQAPQAELPSWMAELPAVEEEHVEKAEEQLPPWVVSEHGEVQQPATEEKEAASLPSWMAELPPTEEPTAFAETELAQPQAGEEQLPAWLSEAQPPVEAMPSAQEEIETTAALPAFLRAEEKTEQPAEPLQPVVSEMPTEVVPPTVKPIEPDRAIVGWVQELQVQTLAAAERAAAQEEVVAQKVVQPVTPVEELPQAVEARAVEIQVAPVAPARAPKRARKPKGYDRLLKARGHRNGNRLHRALEEYDYLVQHAPRLAKQVIEDLELIVQDPDVPLEAHRILGDAYTHVDRLSEALEQYRFVLEHVS